tara:strand:+ start:95214 stop:95594 length:381 start_codon:yes stop_codon:yes gene_type:complete
LFLVHFDENSFLIAPRPNRCGFLAYREISTALIELIDHALSLIAEICPDCFYPTSLISGKGTDDLLELKQRIAALIREKLIFRAHVELVAPNSLPKFEYKAKLVRELDKKKANNKLGITGSFQGDH